MAGRIRIGVAIVAGGVFGALVVLWGGLGPDSDGRGEFRSADGFQCEVQAGCVPSASLTPVLTPAPSVGVTRPPTRPRPPSTSRAGRPLSHELAAAAAGAENPAAMPTPTQASPTSTATPGETAPSASSDDPVGVVVEIPPIVLPTCILNC